MINYKIKFCHKQKEINLLKAKYFERDNDEF